MSLGAKIGVGVGCGTVGIVASGIAIFFLCTPRERTGKTAMSQPDSNSTRDAGGQEKAALVSEATTQSGALIPSHESR